MATNIIIDPSKKLAEYIKFDPALGREQHISMGKESSLSNADIFNAKGGVSLTQFAPFKEKAVVKEEDEDEAVNPENLTFEEKMELRHKSEAYKEREITL